MKEYSAPTAALCTATPTRTRKTARSLIRKLIVGAAISMIVAPAYAWMPSDTDTAIGLLGALADGLSAASQAQAQAQQNAAKQTAAARIVNKFSQVSRAMRSHGIKPAYWCNDNWCDSAYVINAGSRGLLITYSALSRANGSTSYVVCYRANAIIPPLVRIRWPPVTRPTSATCSRTLIQGNSCPEK